MKLFVARLPQSATSESLKSLFETYGEVKEAKVIFDRETGMSKGFGFIEMTSDEEAKKAVSHLNGFEVDGNEILVKESESISKQSNESRSNTSPKGDRWDSNMREARNSFSNRPQDQRRSENGWEESKNLRPRRKRI